MKKHKSFQGVVKWTENMGMENNLQIANPLKYNNININLNPTGSKFH